MDQKAEAVTRWAEQEGRQMPWRETKDPYRIWIAEVVLQQTRIEQGIAYYERFLARFPDVQSLASASTDEVLKAWEGLGYYSRARNLHHAARELVLRYNGRFPEDWRELIKLKGIGPYTARAIGSFAFGNPVGVLDGNVLRVLSRVTGEMEPVDQPATRRRLQEEIDRWVKGSDARSLNFAMMDIGATICSPKRPACLICPLEPHCIARHQGLTALLPQKKAKALRPVRYFHFYVVSNAKDEIAVRQRPANGLWGGLYETPNLEVPQEYWALQQDALGGSLRTTFKHVFTHFDMMLAVYSIEAEALPPELGQAHFIPRLNISNFAFAKAVNKIFAELQVTPDPTPIRELPL